MVLRVVILSRLVVAPFRFVFSVYISKVINTSSGISYWHEIYWRQDAAGRLPPVPPDSSDQGRYMMPQRLSSKARETAHANKLLQHINLRLN